MEKKKEELKEDIELEDYEGYKDIDDDENEDDEEIKVDAEINYDDFNKPNDFDIEADYEEEQQQLTFNTKKEKIKTRFTYENTRSLVSFFKIYGFIGIIIALILISYFITKGNFTGLFLYILLLIGSYFLGYFVMSALDKPKTED